MINPKDVRTSKSGVVRDLGYRAEELGLVLELDKVGEHNVPAISRTTTRRFTFYTGSGEYIASVDGDRMVVAFLQGYKAAAYRYGIEAKAINRKALAEADLPSGTWVRVKDSGNIGRVSFHSTSQGGGIVTTTVQIYPQVNEPKPKTLVLTCSPNNLEKLGAFGDLSITPAANPNSYNVDGTLRKG